MNEIEIGNAMRRLPRTNASPRFTSDVLRRLEQRNGSHARVTWRFAAVLTMAILVMGIALQTREIHQRHARLAALRLERQQLAAELQQVKSNVDDPRPVVVLENADTRVIVPVANRRLSQNNQQPIIY